MAERNDRMYSMTVSYVFMSENKLTGDWEASDRHSFTVYGSTKEKVEKYAEAEYAELKEMYSDRGWEMDDFYDKIEEVPEYEADLYEDGDVEER